MQDAEFTRVPNWLIADMPNWSGSATKVVLAVARKTYGWGKDSDRISFSQLLELTGLGRESLTAAIQELLHRCVIRREPVKNSYIYGFTNQFEIRTDLGSSKRFGNRTDLQANGSEIEPKTVRNPNTQKKRKKDHEDVVAAIASTSSSIAEELEMLPAPELTQPTLTAVSGTPPPSSAAPPAPSKPKRERKPPAAADVQALYDPLHELTGVPRKSHAAIALRVAAGNLRTEYQATADEVPAFGRWFAKHSTAARVAQREQRPLGSPTVKQVYGLWGQYVIWRDAQRPPPRPTIIPDDDRPLAKFAPGEARARYERIRAEMAERNQRAAAD